MDHAWLLQKKWTSGLSDARSLNFFCLDHVLLMLSIQLTCIGKQPRICFGNIHWTSHCKLINQASMSGVHLLFPCSSAILYFDGMQIQLGSGPGRPTESGSHVQIALATVWLHFFFLFQWGCMKSAAKFQSLDASVRWMVLPTLQLTKRRNLFSLSKKTNQAALMPSVH